MSSTARLSRVTLMTWTPRKTSEMEFEPESSAPVFYNFEIMQPTARDLVSLNLII
jgi:hypothetical protein